MEVDTLLEDLQEQVKIEKKILVYSLYNVFLFQSDPISATKNPY